MNSFILKVPSAGTRYKRWTIQSPRTSGTPDLTTALSHYVHISYPLNMHHFCPTSEEALWELVATFPAPHGKKNCLPQRGTNEDILRVKKRICLVHHNLDKICEVRRDWDNLEFSSLVNVRDVTASVVCESVDHHHWHAKKFAHQYVFSKIEDFGLPLRCWSWDWRKWTNIFYTFWARKRRFAAYSREKRLSACDASILISASCNFKVLRDFSTWRRHRYLCLSLGNYKYLRTETA